MSHRETYFLCYVTTATGWGFTSCHWHKKQAKMEHFLSTLALRGHSNLANLSFLFKLLFVFQTFYIYNVLFIMGCWGERTVRIRKVEGSIPFVSTTSLRTAYRSQRLFIKSHFSLILSQLLSKPNPLGWASIWFWVQP